MKLLNILWMILVFLSLAVQAEEKTVSQAFIRNRSIPAELSIPFALNRRLMGEILVLLNDEGVPVEAEATSLEAMLVDTLDPSVLAQIQAHRKKLSDGSFSIPLEALREEGLSARFDEEQLVLLLDAPPELLHSRGINLGRRRPPQVSGVLVPPSDFSSYLNMSFGQDITWPNREEARGEFEHVANFHGIVLEDFHSVTEGELYPYQRGDLRLNHDLVGPMLRVSAGDLAYPIGRFMRFRSMAGLSVQSQFDIEPYRVTTPISSKEILLKTPSRVRVYANDRLIRTLDLPAGRHALEDFPVNPGLNSVRLEITDDTGRIETVLMPSPFDETLLKPGLHEVSYALGAPSTDNGPTKTYDSSKLTVSVQHRLGLNERHTTGIFAQGDRFQRIAGFQWIWATPVGNFSIEPALSSTSQGNSGVASRLTYLYTDSFGPHGSQRSLGLGFLGRSRRFMTLGAVETDNLTAYELSTTLAHGLIYKFFASLGAQVEFNKIYSPESYDGLKATITIGKSWDSGLQTSLSATRTRLYTGENQLNGLLLLSYSFPDSRQHMNAIANSDSAYTRADWNWAPERRVGSLQGGAGIERDVHHVGIDARASVSGNRGVIALEQEANVPQSEGASHRTGVRLSTALLYSGGVFALGRPVTDSFALIKGSGALADEGLVIDPREGGTGEAFSDWIGPAALSELSSYRVRTINVDLANPTATRSLPASSFVIHPTFKSGTLVAIEEEFVIPVRARVLTASGAPVALKGAILKNSDGRPFIPREVFTNRGGVIFLEALEPGRYQITFYDERLGQVEFDIPSTVYGIYDKGDLKLAH